MNELFNRELSWLSFNHRVLQEAADATVPLFERIKFLAIYSSNLDEFFRVRVASLRSLLDLKKKKKKKLDFSPELLLAQIQKTVHKQQEAFGSIFREEILPGLKENNIFVIKDNEVPEEQADHVREYFRTYMFQHILPVIIEQNNISLFLKNKAIYLAVRFQKQGDSGKKRKKRIALIEIPVHSTGRFLTLQGTDGKTLIMFADDVLRFCLNQVLPGYEILETYSVKLTRDAELYIDDEFSGNLRDKIKSSLSKRTTGAPCRFLYDKQMPADFLTYLRKSLKLQKDDLFPGGRYHNFSDLFTLPLPSNNNEKCYELMPALNSAILDQAPATFEAIREKDILLHYPYQSYDYVARFLSEAANDPLVKSIKITLYRNASGSKIIKALIDAARNGKKVTAFVEIKARFDEELNFKHAEEMEEAGIKVLYSFPGLKVHAKICFISREEDKETQYYAYLSTGNFNEKTAAVYSDFGLFTSKDEITKELKKIFDFLSKKSSGAELEKLIAAPFNLREVFTGMIRNEALNASQGKKAYIILKLNSLEDPKIIKELYKAAEAGVKIYIIVRGICCLVPKRNIRVTSIVDRFLEHSRIYIFNNGGEEKIFLASADMMRRNLNRRVELCFPITDKKIKAKIKAIVRLHLRDNVKARIINRRQTNPYCKSATAKKIRAQYATYEYLNSRETEQASRKSAYSYGQPH